MKGTGWTRETLFDIVMLALGIFLFLSPSIFGYAALAAAAWSAWISGLVIIVLAFAALAAFAEWEEWLAFVVGIWVAVSPWLLGFTTYPAAMNLHLLVGVAVMVVSAAYIWMVHHEPPRIAA
ncbi:SPW repeat protein [Methylovirgula sp. 4M-Z18]|uniref:SPW repeat protein n=1 Tax=Methylovirgula sp. 4M-Z18 TaxID=2293567 RepID=UPI000E2F23FD|nr:SPW repeat protein [Methylovirgula sp. 4M-Z18]RFB81620.1 hypothetical protein DYH55_08180 [Methylovirgula sp. 4M-Z18]